MKHLILLILIISGYQSLAQKTNAELEREISTLKSNQEIRAYWTKLHQDDQSVRGKVTEEQRETDRENIPHASVYRAPQRIYSSYSSPFSLR